MPFSDLQGANCPEMALCVDSVITGWRSAGRRNLASRTVVMSMGQGERLGEIVRVAGACGGTDVLQPTACIESQIHA